MGLRNFRRGSAGPRPALKLVYLIGGLIGRLKGENRRRRGRPKTARARRLGFGVSRPGLVVLESEPGGFWKPRSRRVIVEGFYGPAGLCQCLAPRSQGLWHGERGPDVPPGVREDARPAQLECPPARSAAGTREITRHKERRVPRRNDIQKILLIGSGPIVIGQACEFDYSGTQACKALREEGYEVVLVNSNPATIMTDPGMADRTYIEPLTWEIVAKVIEAERPDALLPTLGGQTGLNLAMDLARARRAGTIRRGDDRRQRPT